VITPEQWAFIRDLGFGGLMTVALLGGFRQWYVWRWVFKALEADRDFWRSLALRSLGTADKAIDIAVAKKDDG
jgi:hypothetical protein